MILYPAIDLMNGLCVRLAQGCFDAQTIYNEHPLGALKAFAYAGAEWAHIVDLDGARAGAPRQHALLQELTAHSSLSLQVAGGIRTREDLERLFDAGAQRAVIGSLAAKAPELVRTFLEEFGAERIALALDVRIEGGTPLIAVNGWAKTSRHSLWDVAALYPQARHIIITDISRDGMMSGPNAELIGEAVERLSNAQVQASGGVSSLEDVHQLANIGASGAIVGKALWEGRVELTQALGRACA
ncbi:MAG TPA: 1-(5-phosphoribosyl)-5-[(5-phosphoribosylamino)methylideneamino] imidazole-4-carboxamide isomerase [Sphingomicrobium sp.]|nr:1-(5-phosphoribosyl)-5-[(5-phosphoribosylamino)methylideneamino] imidazole-4-carboxamide isomerase [Sphingomicrobium sp.]